MHCSFIIKHSSYEKKNLTERACEEVAGFDKLYADMQQKTSLAGKSASTLQNYTRHLAKLALHYDCLPTDLDTDQVNDYLYLMQQRHDTPSDSYFKFTVYGLRFAYRMYGMKDKRIELPSIKKEKKLPVVLSREEVRRLLQTPSLLKHRVLLGLLYGCGLRCFEVRNVQLRDIDFDRGMLHVRQGKGKKDRYVPLGEMLIRGLKKYLGAEQPEQWLFNGKPDGKAGGDFDCRYSQRGVQWAVRQAGNTAGISKEMTVHTLRHTYATHLLEEGLDILSIRDLLGHECIDTTMVYLHVAQSGRVKPFSPLDKLFGKRNM